MPVKMRGELPVRFTEPVIKVPDAGTSTEPPPMKPVTTTQAPASDDPGIIDETGLYVP
jgi:hypothetical protein